MHATRLKEIDVPASSSLTEFAVSRGTADITLLLLWKLEVGRSAPACSTASHVRDARCAPLRCGGTTLKAPPPAHRRVSARMSGHSACGARSNAQKEAAPAAFLLPLDVWGTRSAPPPEGKRVTPRCGGRAKSKMATVVGGPRPHTVTSAPVPPPHRSVSSWRVGESPRLWDVHVRKVANPRKNLDASCPPVHGPSPRSPFTPLPPKKKGLHVRGDHSRAWARPTFYVIAIGVEVRTKTNHGRAVQKNSLAPPRPPDPSSIRRDDVMQARNSTVAPSARNSQGQLGRAGETRCLCSIGKSRGRSRGRCRLLADEDALVLTGTRLRCTIVRCIKGFAAIITLRVGEPITPYSVFFASRLVVERAAHDESSTCSPSS